MLNFFTFDGKMSTDFGLYITDAGIYRSSAPEYETVSVPGRNGDLLIDNGRYKNVDVTYPAIIYEDFDRNYEAMTEFLLSRRGHYLRLEDTFLMDEYRIASFTGNVEPKTTIHKKMGSFLLRFNSKPQRYLKSGEHSIDAYDGTIVSAIYNPTQYDAMPLLRIYGVGSVDINGEFWIEITQADGYTDFDCDLMNAYKDDPANNKNQYVRTSTTESIVLRPGRNMLYPAGVTKISVIPRWYKI